MSIREEDDCPMNMAYNSYASVRIEWLRSTEDYINIYVLIHIIQNIVDSSSINHGSP